VLEQGVEEQESGGCIATLIFVGDDCFPAQNGFLSRHVAKRTIHLLFSISLGAVPPPPAYAESAEAISFRDSCLKPLR